VYGFDNARDVVLNDALGPRIAPLVLVIYVDEAEITDIIIDLLFPGDLDPLSMLEYVENFDGFVHQFKEFHWFCLSAGIAVPTDCGCRATEYSSVM